LVYFLSQKYTVIHTANENPKAEDHIVREDASKSPRNEY